MSGFVHWTTEQLDILRQGHAKGLSYSRIAIEINEATGSNFTRSAVAGRVNRTGDLPRRAMHTPPSLSKIRIVRPKIAAAPKVKPAPIIRGDFLHIPFLDLKPSHCRYPDGEGFAATYCGQPKIKGSAFCAYCHSICYERPDAGRARYTNYIARKFAA